MTGFRVASQALKLRMFRGYGYIPSSVVPLRPAFELYFLSQRLPGQVDIDKAVLVWAPSPAALSLLLPGGPRFPRKSAGCCSTVAPTERFPYPQGCTFSIARGSVPIKLV